MFDELMLVLCAASILGIKTLVEHLDKSKKNKKNGKKV
jgi:hypothetical protein